MSKDKTKKELNTEDVAPVVDDQPNDTTLPDELQLLEDRYKRLAAEFDNYRRRTEEERQALVGMVQARTLLELTPVLDNFRRATNHLPEDLKGNNWVTGVLYVEKQLEGIFEQLGLQKIKTVGEPFNPQLHEAIETEPNETIDKDHICSEVEAGYQLNGKVLKPAKVKVSSGKAS